MHIADERNSLYLAELEQVGGSENLVVILDSNRLLALFDKRSRLRAGASLSSWPKDRWVAVAQGQN